MTCCYLRTVVGHRAEHAVICIAHALNVWIVQIGTWHQQSVADVAFCLIVL